MTEPTDAELKAMWQLHAADIGGIFYYARAVLAKWGTPPAAEGEPECTCSAKDAPFGTCCKVRSAFERWYDEQNYGRLQPFDVFKGGWIERHRLSSTPQPTRAQAGAVPQYRLLHSGVDRIEDDDEFLSDDTTTWAIDPNGIFSGNIYGGHVLRPARRRIKGGQHVE